MLLYLSGPITAPTREARDANIERALDLAAKCWAAGHVVVCPHGNTRHFEEREGSKGLTHDDYLRGDFTLMDRCDAALFMEGWDDSRGAKAEADHAAKIGLPCYFHAVSGIPPLHPAEVRCPNQVREFARTLGKMYRVHLDKNADYSPANILATGEQGLVTRLWDKIARLMNLTGFRFKVVPEGFAAPSQPKNEAIDDTLLDAANYGVIGYLLRRGAWGN